MSHPHQLQTRVNEDTHRAVMDLVTPGASAASVVRGLVRDALLLRGLLSRLSWQSVSASEGVLVLSGTPDDLRAILERVGGAE